MAAELLAETRGKANASMMPRTTTTNCSSAKA